MKLFITTAILFLNLTNAHANTEELESVSVEVDTILYGGTTSTVAAYLEINLRNRAIKECGGKEKVVRIENYNIEVSLPGRLTFDLENQSYEQPSVFSLEYPRGRLTADLVCSK